MIGAAQRLIKAQGTEYTVRNDAGGSDGGRDVPDYSDDGTLVGVLERRSMPTAETLSSGEEVEVNLEIRAVYDSSEVTIVGAGEAAYPTKLVHPDGQTFDVVADFPEDSGVTVLTVVRN